MAACITMATAAITMNASTQPDILTPLHARVAPSAPSSRRPAPIYSLRRLRRFALVRFLAHIDCCRNRILLPRHDLLASLDQVFRALAQFPRLALRVFAAFVGLVHQVFAGLFTRLWREKN